MLNEIDLSRIDLNLLVFFEVVLAERHVGRAAKVLSLSPSAVSHGLGRLRKLFADPLFLRTPKGVVPTARASELAAPIADVLARVRSVIATAVPFDAASSTRRFTIGAPDGVAVVILPALLTDMRSSAPHIDLSVRHLLPQSALTQLEARAIDVAIAPIDDLPARFVARTVYEDDFVIAARIGHPFLKSPTLARYCQMQHILVSDSADAHGFVDVALAQKGLTRRVALAAPNFMLALAALSDTDLVAALPRSMVKLHAGRFGVASAEVPLPLRRDELCAIVPQAAMMDAGLAWLLESLHRAGKSARVGRKKARSR